MRPVFFTRHLRECLPHEEAQGKGMTTKARVRAAWRREGHPKEANAAGSQSPGHCQPYPRASTGCIRLRTSWLMPTSWTPSCFTSLTQLACCQNELKSENCSTGQDIAWSSSLEVSLINEHYLDNSMWLAVFWCSSWVSGLNLWGGRTKFRILDKQRGPGPT